MEEIIMKKLRFVSALLAIICLALPLAACSQDAEIPTATIDQIFDITYKEDADPMITKYATVPALNQYATTYNNLEVKATNASGELVYISGTNTDEMGNITGDRLVLVYNMVDNKVVYKNEYVPATFVQNEFGLQTQDTAKSVTVDFKALVDYSYDEEGNMVASKTGTTSLFTVTTATTTYKEGNSQTKYAVTLYNVNGEKINSSDEEAMVELVGEGMYQFEDTLYLETDNKLEKISDIPAYNEVVDFDHYINKHFYATYRENSAALKGIRVYDDKMNVVYSWCYGETGADVDYHILNNGSIVAQVRTELPEDAATYDFQVGTEKYALESFLLNPYEKVETALELDFVIMSNACRSETRGDYSQINSLNQTIENVGYVVFIEDQRINYANMTLVSLSNEAVINSIMAPVASNTKTQLFETTGNGYFTVLVDGQTYIFDNTGAQVATYNGDLEATYKFLIHEDKGIIYDYKLNQL